jgi:hypothetical protein
LIDEAVRAARRQIQLTFNIEKRSPYEPDLSRQVRAPASRRFIWSLLQYDHQLNGLSTNNAKTDSLEDPP